MVGREVRRGNGDIGESEWRRSMKEETDVTQDQGSGNQGLGSAGLEGGETRSSCDCLYVCSFPAAKKVNSRTKRWYKDVGLGFKTPAEAINGTYIGTYLERMDLGMAFGYRWY
jgi:hypothetical protein